ncbi:MAG: hypothetical protein K2K06_11510 [Oscillospiraceae bacterium]|nr:hypothetical protein [Oscillospiraceae bacterium]
MIKKEMVKFISDISVKVESLDDDVVKNKEKTQVLHMYRKLNIINKVSITSRIEGMLEAQMAKK